MKSTNEDGFQTAVRNYILKCIDADDAEIADTERAKAEWLASEFNRVANYPANVKRMPNLQHQLADYLAGLPIGIACYNGDIIRRAEEWHECRLTDKQAETVVDQWFRFLALNIIRLWKRNGIDVYALNR